MYTDDMMNSRARMGNSCACETAARSYGCSDGCGSYDTDTASYSCDHGHTWGLDGYPLGMVFVPLQRFDNICDLETAMKNGTIFEELVLPFECGKGVKGGCCNG